MVDHELINIRQDEKIDLHKIKNYLNELLKIDIDKINILQYSGGHANLTYLISFNNKEFVLRRPPLGPVAPSSHDMAREHMVQRSLNKLFPLAPKSIHLCEDDKIIGSKFHLIERKKGIVIRKEMRPELDGSRNKIRSLSFKMIDILAELHKLDPSKVGLGNFGRPDGFVLRQLNGWEDRWEKASEDEIKANRFNKLVRYLRSNIPEPQGATILHNDFKLDNIMWDVDNPLLPVAVFDWDMCTRGDPLMDLGHLLNYWIDEDDDYEANLITSMPVKNILYPKKSEIIDHYALKTGFSIKDVDWYYAFGAFKLAVIIQQIYVRFLKGQTQDERFANFGKRIEALISRANGVFNFN
jgi:aminoglycoside phosphotransferase (APT) family kinase protein